MRIGSCDGRMTEYTVLWAGRGPLTDSAGWQTRSSYLTEHAEAFSPTTEARRAVRYRDRKADIHARKELLEQVQKRPCKMNCGRMVGASDTLWGFARCNICRGVGHGGRKKKT